MSTVQSALKALGIKRSTPEAAPVRLLVQTRSDSPATIREPCHGKGACQRSPLFFR